MESKKGHLDDDLTDSRFCQYINIKERCIKRTAYSRRICSSVSPYSDLLKGHILLP